MRRNGSVGVPRRERWGDGTGALGRRNGSVGATGRERWGDGTGALGVGTEIDGRRDMEKMTFTTDRTTVTEGEIVEVRWDCPGAESGRPQHRQRIQNQRHTPRNERQQAFPPQPLEGAHTAGAHRPCGRQRLLESHKGESEGDTRYAGRDRRPPWRKDGMAEAMVEPAKKWQSLLTRYRLRRQAMPKEKRLASNPLLILGGVMLLAAVFPMLLFVGLLGLAVYLMGLSSSVDGD